MEVALVDETAGFVYYDEGVDDPGGELAGSLLRKGRGDVWGGVGGGGTLHGGWLVGARA